MSIKVPITPKYARAIQICNIFDAIKPIRN